MPSATHPQAKFDPIPPDLDLNTLVETTPNFDYVPRIGLKQVRELGIDDFEKVVLQHVIIGGKPLVVDGWEADLPPWLFSPTWLSENVGTKAEQVRDLGQATNMPMTIGHYIKNMHQLTKNMTSTNFRDPKRQRLYLKDIDCPDAWYQKLEEIIPQQLFYYNESVGETGGLGSQREKNPFGHSVLGKGIAPAGDLMSSLPSDMRAENFMCYIGHEGTYTPAHREMCASLGQNIMVETSNDDSGEVPGSSIWFMTESKDREVVSEFFLSMLGHDIEIEKHFAQINAWKKAPFPVYIVEQRVGDLILIPPLAPHQVWNRGTRTMKAAWNRTTVETLELAIDEALPRARLVCRDEQYKNKAIIYFTLQKYSDLLEHLESQSGGVLFNEYGQSTSQNGGRVKQLQRDFRRLFELFTKVMITEMFDPSKPEKKVEYLKYDSNVTCSYCRCNIFNRFLTCKSCIITSDDGEIEDTYDVCMECYAMGRSCACISNLSWVEQWNWIELTSDYEKWRARVISILGSQAIDGQIDPASSPQPLNVMRKRFGKKSVAQICQEQLKLRPFRDPSKPYVPEPVFGDSDNEPEADDEGNLIRKKMSKRKSDQRKKTHHSCHICRKAEENWKIAFCSECSRAYCYGVLYRAFDEMPQRIMEEDEWKCPKCRKICSCAACRRDPRQKPYQPKGTLLGHDTKKVADYRSVEILVDFSRTNMIWLRGEGDDNPESSQRMKNLVSKAIEDKARGEQMEDAVGEDDPLYANSGPIDPRLGGGAVAPMASMYANAYEEAGLLHGSQEPPEYDRHGINRHPEHGFSNDPHSLYPEPPEFGRERGMGAGYYQQQPGPEAILYNDLDGGSPGEQNGAGVDMEYPKLPPKEPEIVYATKKRKRPSVAKSTPRHADDAHTEYVQAQKKQKLADARANDKFFMTQHQLDGGNPLIVKLRVPQDFLESLKTTRKARPTRASLRAEAAEEEDVDMVDSPNIVKSDVQAVVVNSDDEFDLALQAFNNVKSARPLAKPESSTRGAARTRGRGGGRARRGGGTRGVAAVRTSRGRGSSEEVDLQLLNEASSQRKRHSTDSSAEEDGADRNPGIKRGRPKSTREAEDDFVPTVSVSRTRNRREKSTDVENSSEDEAEKSSRRPAGKRPSRAPKFTQAVTNDDLDEDHTGSSTRRTARTQATSPAITVPSDSEQELQVVPKPKPVKPIAKRRGRPPRQTKSLGGVAVKEVAPPTESAVQSNRRKSAPVAKMVAGEEEEEDEDDEIPAAPEVPDSQEFTNHFTPLNRREIGGRRPITWAARNGSGSEAPASVNGRSANTRRSVRFEDTPVEESPPPLRFADFGESDSSPEPIDYSIFENHETLLAEQEDGLESNTFPRGAQSADKRADRMDNQQSETPPATVKESQQKVIEPPKQKAKRGRPARVSNPTIIADHDGHTSRTSSRKAVSKEVASNSRPQAVELDEDRQTSRRAEPKAKAISSKAVTPASVDEEPVQDVDSSDEDFRSPLQDIRSPTPPVHPANPSRKGKENASVPPPPPAKKMTEEERILEENRRAKQAILNGIENDNYDYSSDYYSASENGEAETPEPTGKKTVKATEMPIDNQDESEGNPAHSVSPYFSKTSTTKPSGSSAAAKKFSRSVLAASKVDKKRKPGIRDESPAEVDTSMLSLAERRAIAGKTSKFSVLPVSAVKKDKFGNIVRNGDTSRSASSSAKPPTLNGSSPGSGKKRAPGIFGAASAIRSDKNGASAEDSDDDDSDTSIPAVRPSVLGRARRGGTRMLDSARGGFGSGNPRGRGRAMKST